ncbi:MAG: nuclear transport factor 2 family protein [Bacteroidota bacterium]
MKRLIGLLFTLFLFTSTVLFAQSPDEKAIASQIEAMRKAMISGDKQGLSDVLSEQVSYGHSFDYAQNKAQVLDAFVSGKFAFTKIDIKDQKINVEGNTAIVRHKFIADTNDNGKTNSVALGVLQVWKRYQGRWLLYARQGYRLPNTPK